jgi:hypothetical protein
MSDKMLNKALLGDAPFAHGNADVHAYAERV